MFLYAVNKPAVIKDHLELPDLIFSVFEAHGENMNKTCNKKEAKLN